MLYTNKSNNFSYTTLQLGCMFSDYQQGYSHVPAYRPHDPVNNLPQRGSPDGASCRAESPPTNNRSGNFYEARKFQKQLQMDQNYNQLTRQYVVDQQFHRLPTTSPPCYPGTPTSRITSVHPQPDAVSCSSTTSREGYYPEQLVIFKFERSLFLLVVSLTRIERRKCTVLFVFYMSKVCQKVEKLFRTNQTFPSQLLRNFLNFYTIGPIILLLFTLPVVYKKFSVS